MSALLRFGTYNLLNYRMHPNLDGERARWDRVAEVLREADADVWAVQELAGPNALRELAAATGFECAPTSGAGGVVACAPGGNGFGVGLLWRPGIEPVPETMRPYSGGMFFHGLIKVVLDVGGVTVAAASTHLTPFGRHHRVDEAERVTSALTRPPGRAPAVLGSDSNSVSGDRVQRVDGAWTHHVPDPYAGQDWFDALTWQCHRSYDDTGRRTHWADRDAGDTLWSGGLLDVGALLDTPFEPTVGYWHDDPYPARDIDHVRVTRDLAAAVRQVRVHRSDLALRASDHLPKIADLDLT